MINKEKECVEYWHEVLEKIRVFEQLDDSDLVFGARTAGFGHKYKFLPVVSDHEIGEFEEKNGFTLPIEYKTFLQICGAGGAGPYYGIYDFRKRVLPNLFRTPFPYTEKVEYSADIADDDPIWDYPGLAFICEAGCGTDFYLELNGASPGEVWCSWDDACEKEGSFIEFYRKWVARVAVALKGYHRLKDLNERKRLGDKLSFETVVSHMQRDYEIQLPEGGNGIPEGEVWVFFEQAPGKIIANEKMEVLTIDTSDRCSIC